MDNSIFISGYFSENDKEILTTYHSKLEKSNITLRVRDLSGTIMHSALDFVSIEAIAFSYELIKSFVLSGTYDLFKQYVLFLWQIIRKNEPSRVPFTMSITGIPTIYGTENIECKISETLSTEERELVIKEGYELAKQIENHQYELLKRSQYYDAFNAHVFRFDLKSCSFVEMDIAEEVRKKTNEGKRTVENAQD